MLNMLNEMSKSMKNQHSYSPSELQTVSLPACFKPVGMISVYHHRRLVARTSAQHSVSARIVWTSNSVVKKKKNIDERGRELCLKKKMFFSVGKKGMHMPGNNQKNKCCIRFFCQVGVSPVTQSYQRGVSKINGIARYVKSKATVFSVTKENLF